MKLIKSGDAFLILSDEYFVKKGDYIYDSNLKEINRAVVDSGLIKYCSKIIASTLFEDSTILPMIDEFQLQKELLNYLAKEHFPEDSPVQISMRETWTERYINNLKPPYDGIEILNEIRDATEFNIELEMEEYFMFQDVDDDDAPHRFRPKINNSGFINILNIKK